MWAFGTSSGGPKWRRTTAPLYLHTCMRFNFLVVVMLEPFPFRSGTEQTHLIADLWSPKACQGACPASFDLRWAETCHESFIAAGQHIRLRRKPAREPAQFPSCRAGLATLQLHQLRPTPSPPPQACP